MNDKLGKNFIIGFFIVLWISIALFIYNKISFAQKDILFENLKSEKTFQQKKETEKKQDTFFEGENKNEHSKTIKETLVSRKHTKNIEKNTPTKNEEKKEEKSPIKERSEIKKERAMCGTFPCYSGQEFVQMYENFEKQTKLPILSKYIYQNTKADNYIRKLAEDRGYQKRVFADESKLVSLSTYRTQAPLKNAYIKMRDEMEKEGISLHFVSGYRSSTHQRKLFKKKMGDIDVPKITSGIYDKKINEVLKKSSIPAYSKHHSGYAVDFGCGNDYLVYSFRETKCYQWLSHNNFENAKRFGFIPSYPEGIQKQGPDPEPWEFVWVGENFIRDAKAKLLKEN